MRIITISKDHCAGSPKTWSIMLAFMCTIVPSLSHAVCAVGGFIVGSSAIYESNTNVSYGFNCNGGGSPVTPIIWQVQIGGNYATINSSGQVIPKAISADVTIQIRGTDSAGATAIKQITITNNIATLDNAGYSLLVGAQYNGQNYVNKGTYQQEYLALIGGVEQLLTSGPSWSVSGSGVSISNGLLNTANITTNQSLNITATYTYTPPGYSHLIKSITVPWPSIRARARLPQSIIIFPGVSGNVSESSTTPGFSGTVKWDDNTSSSITPSWSVNYTGAYVSGGSLITPVVTQNQSIVVTGSVNLSTQLSPYYPEYSTSSTSNFSLTILNDKMILSGLAIIPPSGIATYDENNSAGYQFKARATFDDGTTSEVIPDSWSDNSTFATIDSVGLLTTTSVSSNQNVTVSASFTYLGVTKSATYPITVTNTNRKLNSLSITGPATVNELSTAQYTVTAVFEDGSLTVAPDRWTITGSDSVGICDNGLLTTSYGRGNQVVTLSAAYTSSGVTMTAEKPVTVLNATNSEAPVTQSASISCNKTQGNGASSKPSISSDGKFVAFTSSASNFGSNDSNGTIDIFIHNRLASTVEQISVNDEGIGGDLSSDSPSINTDGQYVAFTSAASNLVMDNVSGYWHIYVRDRGKKSTERISVSSDALIGNSDSYEPEISDDGRFIVFQSNANNLVPNDTNAYVDIFVHDRQRGATERVSIASGGTQSNNNSATPSISADGRYIVFQSNASNLVANDTNGFADIFVHDRETGVTERVSVSSSGAQSTNNSATPVISADARYVAYQSIATNLVSGDTNSRSDIFVFDRIARTTVRTSVNDAGAQGDGDSTNPEINADGNKIVFQSSATNLVTGDANAVTDIFMRDILTAKTTRVTKDTAGGDPNGGSAVPALDAAGNYVVYGSSATDLISSDNNSYADIFVTYLGSTAGASKIWLTPASQTASIASAVIADVYMDFTGNPTLGGGIDISYNSSLLKFVSFVPNIVTVGDIAFLRMPNNLSLELNGTSFGHFNGMTGQQLIGTVTFDAISSGTATLGLSNNDAPMGGFYSANTFLPQAVTYTGASITIQNNTQPVANNKSISVNSGSTTPVTDILTATDANGDPLTYTIVSNGSLGTATINNPSTGGFTYQPASGTAPGYSGTDTMTYLVSDGKVNSGVATISVTYIPSTLIVATPTITPNGGSILATQSITLATSTSGAAIRYTTNGTTPTTSSTLYSSPFTLAASATVKAIGIVSGYTNSAVASASFTVNRVPVISTVPVTTATVGVAYSYDVNATDADGNTLTYSLTQFPTGMTINASTGVITWTPTSGQVGSNSVTVRVTDNGTPVALADQAYTITVGQPTVSAPTISPNGGAILGTQTITLVTSTSGAAIRYTTDGTNPTASSTLYSSPFTLSASATVKAIGILSGYTNSAVASASFSVNRLPVISTSPVTAATVGAPYSYDVNATDADGHTLTYTLTQFPAGMTISSSSGVIAWTPTSGLVGSNNVTVRVTDNGVPAATADQAFTITVATGGGTGPNLIVNPGFETGAKSPWSGNGSIVTSPVHSGTYAWKIPGNTTGNPNIVQSLSVTAGTQYRVSGWISLTNKTTGNDIGMQVRWYNSSGSEIASARIYLSGQLSSNSGYVQQTADVTAPTGATQARVRLQVNLTNGIGYLDDVSFVALGGGGTPTVSTPTISPNGGAFAGSVSVTLATSTSGAAIRYTTDGTAPTSSSTLYSSPFTLSTSATVKAIGILSGYTNSAVASASFTVNRLPVISTTPVTTATQGVAYSCDVNATDADGNTLTYSLTQFPTGMTINTSTGVIAWTPTSGQVGSNNITVTVTDNGTPVATASQAFTITVASAGGSAAYQQDSGVDGLVSMEAEHFDANVSQGGYNWLLSASPAGYSSEGAMRSNPNTGMNINTGYVTGSPRLDFKVNFVKSGTHYVWIRGAGANDADDSVHAGIDNQAVATSDRITNFGNHVTPIAYNTWYWSKSTMDTAVATINITTLGEHTINVWMREDGFIVDKVVLTTNSNYAPTGTGPAESPRGGMLIYSSTKVFGGAGLDYNRAGAVDGSGNIYIAGSYTGTADFDPTTSTDQRISAGNSDIYLMRLNANGSYGWVRTIGSTGSDEAYSVAVDSIGDVYITGNFIGSVDFDPSASTDLRTAVSEDAFITKIKGDGSYSWTRTMTSSLSAVGNSVITDSVGNIYVTGNFQGTVNFNPAGTADNRSAAGGNDIFLTKYSANGTYGWTKVISNTGSKTSNSVAVDNNNNIYITGYFQYTVDFNPDAGIDSYTASGSFEVFLTRINADGTYGWTRTMGGPSIDIGYAVAVGGAGAIYVTGQFNSSNADFNPGSGTDTRSTVGGNDVFITKLDVNGNYGWTKTMGSAGAEIGHALAVDGSGNVYVTGRFMNTIDFAGDGTEFMTSAGSFDTFVTRLNLDGSYGWTKRLGGTSADVPYGLARDINGNVYVTGTYNGTVDFSGVGSEVYTSQGSTDVFITKYQQ